MAPADRVLTIDLDRWRHGTDAEREEVARTFDASMRTLKEELGAYDTGWWSLYEQSGTRLRMLASPFYHRLHVVQLRIQAALTGDPLYAETAGRWEGYARSGFKRRRAWLHKAVFKLFYY